MYIPCEPCTDDGNMIIIFNIFVDKVVSENELQELEELSKILSTYKDQVHLKRQVSKCFFF
jgi:hypothetical protein